MTIFNLTKLARATLVSAAVDLIRTKKNRQRFLGSPTKHNALTTTISLFLPFSCL